MQSSRLPVFAFGADDETEKINTTPAFSHSSKLEAQDQSNLRQSRRLATEQVTSLADTRSTLEDLRQLLGIKQKD
jgi:hypothetical protein